MTTKSIDEQTRNDLNWGEDRRVFPKLAAWFQRRLQITWMPHTEPPSLALALFPPCLFLNVPLFWKAPKKLPDAAAPLRPVLHLRMGWRRDMNSGEFYPSAALKQEERTKLW